MKNIESCKLAMMDSPSPPSLKETESSTNDEPLVKKVDSSTVEEADSSSKKPEENGHSEVKEAEKEAVPAENGHESNGKAPEENGLKTPTSPERPDQEKSLDSEISALVQTIDTHMDDSECNDSSSADEKEAESKTEEPKEVTEE